MSTDEQVHWPVPPQEGYRFEDLFTLPDLPEHTELIDGSLVFMAPQANAHDLLTRLLTERLREVVTDGWRVRTHMLVRLTDRTALEPDVLVVREAVATELARGSFEVPDVLLACEVVSASSIERDLDTKLHKYANAGIPHYWIVEWLTGTLSVTTYRLDDDGRYEPTGEHVGRLRTDEPVSVDVDLTEIERM